MAERVTRKTVSHAVIKRWANARGGKPATVAATAKGEPGVLRIDFPGGAGADTLQEITWDEFFAKFDESNLAFVFQDQTAGGKPSRFCKLVSRDAAAKKKAATAGDKSDKKAVPKKDKAAAAKPKAKPAAAKASSAAKKPAAKRTGAAKTKAKK